MLAKDVTVMYRYPIVQVRSHKFRRHIAGIYGECVFFTDSKEVASISV